MKRSLSPWARAAAWGAAAGLVFLLTGDGGFTATPPGIDPLEILNLQVKPNVLFIIDTSLSMALTPDASRFVGGDDVESRFYKVKQAVRTVVATNQDKANMGMFSYNPGLGKIKLTGVEFATTSGTGVTETYRGGPFVYVSKDASANAWNDQTPGGANDQSGFFNTTGVPAFTSYDSDSVSNEVFQSLDNDDTNFAKAYPNGCVAGTTCRYYMRSRRFRNNQIITYDPTPSSGGKTNGLVSVGATTCPAPPAGLLGDDATNTNDGTEPRACFKLVNVDTGQTTVYYFASATFGHEDDTTSLGSVSCGETGPVTPLQLCSAASNKADLDKALRLELPEDASGAPIGLTTAGPVDYLGGDCNGTAPDNGCPNVLDSGMRTGFRTPLGAALASALTYFRNPVFLPANRPAAVLGLQKNFVILLTDGDETCGGNAVTSATNLYNNNSPTGSVANDRVETLVVGFSPSVSVAPLNAIARAGSGNTRDAYTASNLTDLIAALTAALGETTASGSFSTESSITERIFEYGAVITTPVTSPSNPTTRYAAGVPVLLQTSFDMPGYTGHLKAFFNASITGDRDGVGAGGLVASAPSAYKWDAGEKLLNRVWYGTTGSNGMGDPTVVANRYTFATLHNNWANAGAPLTSASTGFTAAKIKRRIYTSPRNGTFPYSADASISTTQRPLPIWPPSTTTTDGLAAVAPADDTTPGLLDAALGVNVPDLATLQNTYGMCSGSVGGVAFDTSPTFDNHPCNNADPAIVLLRARREFRETLLASAAGAEFVRDAQNDPVRSACGGTNCATGGDILYRAKTSIMAESTLAVPAVVSNPLETMAASHIPEYTLFRDGPRASGLNDNICSGGTGTCIDQGFGLRNPDKAAGAAAIASTVIKPAMSVVYHATNAMLHAFRGGPRSCTASTSCPPVGEEGGGEELWAYVPYDQLDKIALRLLPQSRDPHIYMNASSLRFGDVFVPAGSSFTVAGNSYTGRWRTAMFFGRGIGGKYYTALDITAPGEFTRNALNTNPPALMWNRGNPDTQDGTVGGTANSATSGSDLGVADSTAYQTMGQTWSVPAVAGVPPANYFNKEQALFVGSGYSPGSTTEGKTFYVIDPLTGDILYADTKTDSAGTKTCSGPPEDCTLQPNAIVANPAAYIPSQLIPGFIGNPDGKQATLAYVGDLHGRLWKWIATSPSLGLVGLRDYTVDQPIANAAGLINVNGKPHVFIETGNDNRVDNPPTFLFSGVRDDMADTNPTPFVGVPLFTINLNSTITPDLTSYRGTAQPSTAFNSATPPAGRVFFVGTKFNEAATNCISSFDSVVFALGAETGAAAYDLNTGGADDRFVQKIGTRVNAVRGYLGQVILDIGELGSSPNQLPPAPGVDTSPTGGTITQVFSSMTRANTTVCR